MLAKRSIPNTQLTVSPLSLGTALWGSILRGKPLETLYAAYRSAGGNFLDSAHCYAFWRDGLGASETSLGELVRQFADRDNVILATKCGHPDGGPQYPRPDRFLSPQAIASDLRDSLDRLRLDSVDLLYLHRDDSRMPVGEMIDALNEHVSAGQIRYFGASNWSTARIAEANTYAKANGRMGFCISQSQWSLAWPNAASPSTDPSMRFITPEERDWHMQQSFPLTAYTASANGYMAGASKSAASFDNAISRARKARVAELSARIGRAPNTIALAYLINQPFVTIPVVGTHDPLHLAEALLAAETPLTPAELTWLGSG